MRSDGRRFELTARVLELGYAFLSSSDAARGRRAPPRAARRRGPRVLLGQRARRRRHRLRRARADRADHARLDQRRHPLPGLRDLDGARAAGRDGSATSSTRFLARAELLRLSRARSPPSASCAPSSTACAARAGRSSTRSSRRACARWPRRSATAAAAWSRRSTSPRTRAAPRSTRCSRDAAAAAAGDGGADRGRPARRLRELAAAVGGVSAPAGAVPARTPRPPAAGERAGATIVAAVVLLAINLRSVLAGLPPLVADIRADLGLSARRGRRADHAARAVHGRVRAGRAAARRARADGARARRLRAADRRGHRACAALGTTASLFAAGLAIGVAIALAQALLPVLIRDPLRRRLRAC